MISTQRATLAQANHEFLTAKKPTTKEVKDLCERLETLATDNPGSMLGALACRVVKCLKDGTNE